MDDLSAIVLAGGKGTRIAGLYPDIPKPMIPAAGRPFLHWVTEWLVRRGVSDVVLSLGHKAEVIEDWAARRNAELKGRARLACLRESRPLGTGGAVIACLDSCRDWVLVMNGDSLLDAGIGPLFHRVQEAGLDGAIIGVDVPDASRFGSLTVGGDGLLRGFAEKRPGAGLINGGVYIFRKSIFDGFQRNEVMSMESDIFPALLAASASIVVDVCTGSFLDIGTPESVVLADEFVNILF
ncbi:D-glycero-D-manno-heptose 1-phosphate guanosyltransferase [Paramagnetospirillum magnetotacticum MS-1]|uniref:D-glycero-D-manno-heptose 1-phosphate guanosyltransferase n=1 Tax=Paramagnetospirillum magnetotacticum MS-1 TaxID=272627 RepID=A0A0C2YWY8_PARME|nr:nucleotidyltransferase family protein [Paramagnetospirillum magnetotacticum]KIL99200.1 D-glycero-D-manno-heptose 1-phosphate guanosyltransferase [Paramagnetospirillum magnetotacticum MS-1]